MRLIHILILSLFLSGCSLFQKKVEPPAIQPKVVNIDSAALEPCANLKESVQVFTFDDIVNEYADIATSYAVCAKKQSTSIKLLKEFSNTK